MTKKVSKESLNISDEKISELKKIIPEVFTEGKIDFEKLQRTLGKEINGKDEKYSFSWAGRKEAFKNIQTTAKGTLKPSEKESINWDSTENLFIEGDNLEVLKLLQKAYFNKIKMIYIDPPYNTGKDFVYKDNFKNNIQAYLEQTGQLNGDGVKLTTNPETNGRFHSDWISMIYPRLFVARNLLREDGVIFVSIDDKEVHNLRKIMDEIFGEENFIASLIWNTEGHTDNQFHIKVNHEYLLMYIKDRSFRDEAIGHVIDPNTRKESNLWKGYAENSITKNGPGNPPSEVLLPKGFPVDYKDKSIKSDKCPTEFYELVKKKGYISREITKKFNLSYPLKKDEMIFKDSKLKKDCRVFSGWANVNKLKEFIENSFNPVDNGDGKYYFYLSENGVIYYKKERDLARNIVSVLRNIGTTEQMRSELESYGINFQYPKPKQLIKYLIRVGCEKSDIVLDFFAGSGTTGQAVIEQNKEDGVDRKFICIQLPEIIHGEKEKNIAELAITRLRKTLANNQKTLIKNNLDAGFKVFKLDKSNYKIWEKYEGKDAKELKKQLESFKTPLFFGFKNNDIIYECIIKEGYSLNSKIKKTEIKSNKVFKVTDGDLFFYISLDQEIKDKTINELKLKKEDMFICLDEALNDSKKKNLSIQCSLKVI